MKKKKYKQKYRKQWESHRDLKSWVRPCDGDQMKARCIYCQRDVAARYYDLLRHALTQKHITAIASGSDKKRRQPKLSSKTPPKQESQQLQPELSFVIVPMKVEPDQDAQDISVEAGIRWTREQLKILIDLYEKHDCLYNTNSVDYSHPQKITEAISTIFEQLKELNPKMTPEEIKRKLKVLHLQYLQEHRMVEISKKNGACVDDIYKPKLWCFDRLQFLKYHTNNKTRGNKTNNIPTNLGTSNGNIEKCTAESIHELKKDLENVKQLILQKKADGNNRRFEWLGKQVMEQLVEIDPEYQPKAVLEIQSVIHKYWEKTTKKAESSSKRSPTTRLSSNAAMIDPLRFDDHLFLNF